MRNLLLALATALAACAGPAQWRASGDVLLTVEGRVERAPHTFAREDLARLPPRSFAAEPPGAGRSARFEGVGVSALLGDAIELMPDGDTVVVHGGDGRIAAVPLSSIRQLRPALARAIPRALARTVEGAQRETIAARRSDFPTARSGRSGRGPAGSRARPS